MFTNKAPNSFTLFCKKRTHELKMEGQQITSNDLLKEWKELSTEQKSEYQNQSRCIQFTLDIDNRINNNKDLNIINNNSSSSMIIPNEEEEDSVQPPSSSFYFHHTHEQEVEKEKSNIEYKVIPNLTWSAAAEAAALESLTFNNSMKQKYDNHQPKKVKRPPNAYLLFNRDMRRQMNNQGMTSGEISKNISQIWKQLSNEERNKYFKEESELKQQYNSSNFVYFRRSKAELQQAGLLKKLQKSNSTTIQHQQLQLQQSKKKVYYKKGSKTADESSIPDPRGRKKKKSSDTSLPKHPMSAYLHFAKTMRPIIKKNSPNSKLVEISQQIGLKWRSMTENEMRPWIEMANEDKARYAREMKDRINCNEELDSATIATVAQMVYPNNDT